MQLNPNTNENAPTPAVKLSKKQEAARRKAEMKARNEANKALVKARKEAKKNGIDPDTIESLPSGAIVTRPDYSATKVDEPQTTKVRAKKGKKSAPENVEKAPRKTAAERAAEEVADLDAVRNTVTLTSNLAPSVEIATELQTAWAHFNAKLFHDKLEPVVFSNSRLKKAHGFFWPKQWARRSELKGKVHEIGLDFARLRADFGGGKGSDKLVLSTLVHEMCHQLVEQMGKAPAKPYHCKYWVAAMNMVGLQPVILDAKGTPTGKQTGPNSTHEIARGGAFDAAADELLSTGFKLSWFNEPLPEPVKPPKAKKKAGAKAKHTCSCCGRNAWGAPSLHLFCKGDPAEGEHELTEMDCPRDEYGNGSDDEGGDAGDET